MKLRISGGRVSLPPKKEFIIDRNCYNNGILSLKSFDFLHTNVFQIILIFPSIFSMLYCCSLVILNKVSYVSFSTNLNLYCKGKSTPKPSNEWHFSANMLLLLLSECEFYQIVLLLTIVIPILKIKLDLAKFQKAVSYTLFLATSTLMFTLAVSPAANLICLFVFQVLCHSYFKIIPSWLSILLILLSHDIHLNPGPGYQNNFLNFMNWNLNSMSKDEFSRVRLLEAHN